MLKSQQDVRVNLNEISTGIESPISFTAKILQKLVKNKIMDSQKGPAGGFEIKKSEAGNITLSQVVLAIDGDSIYHGCGLGFSDCDESKPCPMHHSFKLIRNDLKKMLESTSLLDLSKDINNGVTFLNRK